MTAFPRKGEAQKIQVGAEEVAPAAGVMLLFAADAALTIGGAVTGIGASLQLDREYPGGGWGIAACAVGGLGVIFSGATTVLLLADDDYLDESQAFWTFAVVPLLVGGVNVALGAVSIFKWRRARADRILDRDRAQGMENGWSLAPIQVRTRDGSRAPGVGLSMRF